MFIWLNNIILPNERINYSVYLNYIIIFIMYLIILFIPYIKKLIIYNKIFKNYLNYIWNNIMIIWLNISSSQKNSFDIITIKYNHDKQLNFFNICHKLLI